MCIKWRFWAPGEEKREESVGNLKKKAALESIKKWH